MTMLKRFCLSLALAVTCGSLSAASKPNIVFIIADDLGWADVGFNGAAFYETPNICLHLPTSAEPPCRRASRSMGDPSRRCCEASRP